MKLGEFPIKNTVFLELFAKLMLDVPDKDICLVIVNRPGFHQTSFQTLMLHLAACPIPAPMLPAEWLSLRLEDMTLSLWEETTISNRSASYNNTTISKIVYIFPQGHCGCPEPAINDVEAR